MNDFTFKVSLSVLNHLGRQLYRSFTTVLGEAISNSWDADARNVWIDIDRDAANFTIKDDGIGMTSDDFQERFLKIGYSKRKDRGNKSADGRPFIGRKGIGKLALLSCAEKVKVLSKVQGGEYIGGTIDNSRLDEAITDDLTPQNYPLEVVSPKEFSAWTESHDHGTIIKFETIKSGIRNRIEFLKKTIALYFRFSLLDDSFKIFVNGEEVTLGELNNVADHTQFLWNINDFVDPFIDEQLHALIEPSKNISMDTAAKGFVASVEKPSNLKITGTDERVSIDLFVNGRLRQKDILPGISLARITESYLYGQIHLDILDDEKDRFTSSREGIIPDDPVFLEFLEELKSKLFEIISDWDKWRRKHNEEGDSDDTSIPKIERKSGELFNLISKDYTGGDPNWVDDAVNSLKAYAKFNIQSYTECFIAENLLRELISKCDVELSQRQKNIAQNYRDQEKENLEDGHMSIEIRKVSRDLNYLDLSSLAKIIDPQKEDKALQKDSDAYKPIRNAIMHTSLLTDEAKAKLTSTYDNIKGRIKALLSDSTSVE